MSTNPVDDSNTNAEEEENGTPFHFYPLKQIKLGTFKPLQIKALSSLPLSDLISLAEGTSDETGHCIWRGATVFHSMLMTSIKAYKNTHNLTSFFCNKHVLELGSGTGFGGFGLLRILGGESNFKSLSFTDGDVSTVSLAEENYRINFCDDTNNNNNKTNVMFGEYNWSDSPIYPDVLPVPDVVFACDVVYDCSILLPLFISAKVALMKKYKGKEEGTSNHEDLNKNINNNNNTEKDDLSSSLLPLSISTDNTNDNNTNNNSKYFLLSHICRAGYKTKHIGSEEELELEICHAAKVTGFILKDVIRQNEGENYSGGERGSLLIFEITGL